MTTTIEKGRIGESAATFYFTQNGYEVYLPVFGNTGADLVVSKDGILYRVEVKSTSFKLPSGKYKVALRQIRPNRTGNTIKKFNGNSSDLLFIYVEPENRSLVLDSKNLHDRSSIDV